MPLIVAQTLALLFWNQPETDHALPLYACRRQALETEQKSNGKQRKLRVLLAKRVLPRNLACCMLVRRKTLGTS